MSSEPLERLPEANYYRAKTLGNGAYGSVCLVYDDDGNEFAAKTFWEEEAEGNDAEGWGDDDDGGWWDEAAAPGIDCGVLREICMLRLLNGAHPHLMAMHDVSKMVEDGEEKMLMVMPAQAGSLSGAIEGGGLTNKAKMRIAVLSLHALAFLHSHGVIHRDIKPDNILLDHLGDPVLADFSLAKVVGGKAAAAKGGGGGAVGKRSKAERKNKRKACDDAADDEQQPPALTCGMGTPTYTAPEIVNGEAYGVKADVFSLGVVLLELFHGEALDAWKNKHALKQLEEIKAKLSDKPLPSLLKAMLEVDPEQRVSAEEALQRLAASAGKVLAARCRRRRKSTCRRWPARPWPPLQTPPPPPRRRARVATPTSARRPTEAATGSARRVCATCSARRARRRPPTRSASTIARPPRATPV